MEHKTSKAASWHPSAPENFTGPVWNSRRVEGDGGLTMIAVEFSPGARSAWHSHPAGQVLYVISGSGLVRTEQGDTAEISPGDVVHAPPGELHWHGARPDSSMMHLSLTTDGPPRWAEKVTDEEYREASG